MKDRHELAEEQFKALAYKEGYHSPSDAAEDADAAADAFIAERERQSRSADIFTSDDNGIEILMVNGDYCGCICKIEKIEKDRAHVVIYEPTGRRICNAWYPFYMLKRIPAPPAATEVEPETRLVERQYIDREGDTRCVIQSPATHKWYSGYWRKDMFGVTHDKVFDTKTDAQIDLDNEAKSKNWSDAN